MLNTVLGTASERNQCVKGALVTWLPWATGSMCRLPPPVRYGPGHVCFFVLPRWAGLSVSAPGGLGG